MEIIPCSWLNFENLQNFQTNDTSHPLHVNLFNIIIQHIKGPWFYYAMKKNLETHIGGELC